VGRVELLPRELAGAEAMLLLELDGESVETLLEEAARLDALTQSLGGAAALVADDAAGQRRLWQIRRKIGEAVKHLSEYKEADTVVPRSKLVELVEAARAAAARNGLTAICYGHAGDGNIHVNVLAASAGTPGSAAGRGPALEAAIEAIFNVAVRLGGTITGEHGVGCSQARHLPLCRDAVALEVMRQVKRALDPKGLLNPGKVFDEPLPPARHLDA